MIKVYFFARYREELKTAEETFSEQISDTEALLSILRDRGEPWSRVLDSNVLCAVNQVMTKSLTPLKDGDEVGIFPPVTGG